MIDRSELEGLSRETLVERARRLQIERPEVMTRVELADEIVRRVVTDEVARRRARGWLGVARDLVAGLIEQGLHLPDAAALVRRGGLAPTVIRHQPPVATVTLAEIYAAQGHTKRALAMLNEVLAKEPDHEIARSLRDRLAKEREAPRTQRSLGEDAAEALEDEQPPPPPLKVEVAKIELKKVPVVEVPLAPPTPEPAGVNVEAITVPRPEPKPARPRRDQVALLAQGPGSLTVVWELSDETLALARRRDRDGRPVLRLACLVPSHDGAEHHERDVELEQPEGTTLVSGLPERSVLRGAVGYRDARGFRPRALATELSLQPGTRELCVSWSPTGSGSEPAIERMVARLTS